MNDKIKGMTVYVLRNAELFGDCTLGGVSSRFGQLTLVGPGVPEIFEPTDDAPMVRTIRRMIGGRPYVHVEPVLPGEEYLIAHPSAASSRESWMAGGNFCWTSDGRFPNDYPLSIHDRAASAEKGLNYFD